MFVNWQCQQCDQEFKLKNCISDGRYCAIDQFGNKNGRQIVLEDLRQYCLFKKLVLKSKSQKFFEYIDRLHEQCGTNGLEDCSKEIIKQIDFPYEWV